MTPTNRIPPVNPRLRGPGSYPGRRRGPRHPRLVLAINLLLVTFIVGGAAGFAAVWTNAFGFGDKWEHLLARIDLALNPPPDRDSVPTVDSTPRPIRTATPGATARATAGASQSPGSSPATGKTPKPTKPPTPTPPPVRKRVDVKIAADPKAVFAHEVDVDMCAAAGVQMVLAIHGKADTSNAFQRRLDGRVREWQSWKDSHNGRWGPSAMVEALDAYGVKGYEIRAFARRDDALLDAARAISETGAPVILMAWRGAHTWVMNGYRADADPMVFDDATVTGTYVLDPWYPDNSSIWGQSDPPGAFQDASEMVRNFLPWKRPEGLYPQRDGKFLIIAPTIPLGG